MKYEIWLAPLSFFEHRFHEFTQIILYKKKNLKNNSLYVDDFVINVRSLCGFMKINFLHPINFSSHCRKQQCHTKRDKHIKPYTEHRYKRLVSYLLGFSVQSTEVFLLKHDAIACDSAEKWQGRWKLVFISTMAFSCIGAIGIFMLQDVFSVFLIPNCFLSFVMEFFIE